MDFLEVIEQARAVLKSKGRVTYRTLKRQFGLDDEALEDLKEELIDAERVAIDEDGRILVWVGEQPVVSSQQPVVSSPSIPNLQLRTPDLRPPVSYTSTHLADRIRTVAVTDGERKTITALFADLKGSTALIEGLERSQSCRLRVRMVAPSCTVR